MATKIVNLQFFGDESRGHVENFRELLGGEVDLYFDDLDFIKFVWIHYPSINDENDEFQLTSNEKENLIESACDNHLK